MQTNQAKRVRTSKKVEATASGKVKERRRRQKSAVKPSRSEMVAKQEGQLGIDSRVAGASAVPTLTQLALAATDRTIDQYVARGVRSVEHLAMGVVLAALKKGWISNLPTNGTNYVYAAYVYLVQSFYSAMAGTVPTLQAAPKWYWMITQALLPTTTKFKTSYITYKWVLDDEISVVPPPVEVLQSADISFGIPDLTLPKINGFYQIGTPSYSPDEGAAAIKSLFEYWGSEGFTKMVPYSKMPTSDDISAFAAQYPELGSSPGADGGQATTLYSERVIPMPILSKLAAYQLGEYWRGWSFCGRSAGSPGYVIPRLVEFKSEKQLLNKIPPIFKFIDFDEFFEVLSLTLGMALERAAQSQVGLPIPPCPLSPQAVQILLRQNMIAMFANEMAQDLVQNANNSFTYVPFTVSANGVSITAPNTTMKLPTLFAENIRACGRRIVRLKSGDLDFVPILSRKDSLEQLQNYSYNGGMVYTDNAAEVPINLIDLSYFDGSTKKYVSANGPQLIALATTWNEWITALGTFLSPLTTPGQVQGPALLSVLTCTRQLKYTDQQQVDLASKAMKLPLLVKQSSKKDLGYAYSAKNRVGQVEPIGPSSSQFKNFGVLAVTSANTPLAPVWKYHRIMIMPAFTSLIATSGGAIPYRQVFQVEPFRVPMNNLPDGYYLEGAPDLLSLHREMASMDVRTELAPLSEMLQDFQALNEHGEGGFFTQLAGLFAEDVLGIQGGKQIASAIGAATGW